MGYLRGRVGAALFDPVSRQVITGATNVIYVENMNDRIDALRHFDARREALKKNSRSDSLPLQINDFDESRLQATSSSATRKLFTSPDEQELGPSQLLAEESEAPADSQAEQPKAQAVGGAGSTAKSPSALHPASLKADEVRKILIGEANMRPVRMVPVGTVSKVTLEERKFLAIALQEQYPVAYQTPCPKTRASPSRRRYLKYMVAATLKEALTLGASSADLLWDFERGWITFPKHEPDVEGHVHDAVALAIAHGHSHVLEDYGMYVTSSIKTNYALASLCSQYDTASRDSVFNDTMKDMFSPEKIDKTMSTIFERTKFSEACGRKLLCLHSMALEDDGQLRGWNLEPEPTSAQEALDERNPEWQKWRAAMNEEIESMTRYDVFEAVDESAAKGQQILTCKWVMKRKINSQGRVYRYRARLVAQGFRQIAGNSYDPDTISSPVVSKDSLRMFLSLSAGLDLRIRQLDVTAAFLQSKLQDSIFVRAPVGFEGHVKPGQILKCNSAVYGLKQGSSSWYRELRDHLVGPGVTNEVSVEDVFSPATTAELGDRTAELLPNAMDKERKAGLQFSALIGDPCVFVKSEARGRIIVAVYVDDVTYATDSDEMAAEFLAGMRERFDIGADEGNDVEWLLSIAIDQDLKAGTVSMSQQTYIEAVADRFLDEFEKQQRPNTPMLHSESAQLRRTEEGGRVVPKSEFDYLGCVGCLLHCVNCVRCDVAVAVGILARFSNAPGPSHVKAAKRVCAYLLSTKSMKITYHRDCADEKNVPLVMQSARHPLDPEKEQGFVVFADSAYSDSPTRRSTFGHVVMMNGGAISWSSTLAKTVATSTAQAEINSAVEACKTGLHLRLMLSQMTGNNLRKLIIGEDNSSAIIQAGKGIRSVKLAKHYETRLRFLQEVIESGEVGFKYVETSRMLADCMTKPLNPETFAYFRGIMMRE